jgi:hypothetical protein
MTRVRYFKEGDLLVSKPVLCNAKNVTVVITPATLLYSLLDNGEVLVESQGKTLSDVKKRVKNDLVTLGAAFTSEIRTRGNTEKL